MKKTLFIAFICVVIDQLIKITIVSNFSIYHGITIIPNFFSLLYVQNTGAAWSILEGNRLFLIIASFVALFAIYWMFIRNQTLTKLQSITYGVLLGGVLGNLIDRMIRGWVVDYLKFNFFGYHFPIFNFADICIVGSVLLILILLIRGEKNEESISKK